jgi:mycothiol system anti-sigma-R factor
MSCGHPHSTPCSDVLEAISAYLDGELTADDRAVIAQHIHECWPCLHEVDVYREVKVLIARACGGEQVPDDVRARVVSRIRTVSVQWSVEYRQE